MPQEVLDYSLPPRPRVPCGPGHYILDEQGNPKEVFDLLEWAGWSKGSWDRPGRVIGRTELKEVRVSTVFLPLDHGFGGKLMLYETCLFWLKQRTVIWPKRLRELLAQQDPELAEELEKSARRVVLNSEVVERYSTRQEAERGHRRWVGKMHQEARLRSYKEARRPCKRRK